MRFIRHNLGLKMASIILSLVLWDYVEAPLQNQETIKVPIRNIIVPTHLSDEFTFSVEGDPTLQGQASPDAVKSINDRIKTDLNGNLAVYVDLSRVSLGENRVLGSFTPPPGYPDATWQRPEVTVHIDLKVSSKPIKITLVPVGPPVGFAVVPTTVINPPTVIVRGSRAEVDKVTTVKATINLKGLDTPGQTFKNTSLVAYDGRDRRVEDVEFEPPFVDIFPVLEEASQAKPLSVSPYVTGHTAPGYEVTAVMVKPEQVTISGPVNKVQRIDILRTKPIDISGISGSRVYRAEISAVSEVKGLKFSAKVVTVTVKVQKYFEPKTPQQPPTQIPSTSPTAGVPPSNSGH